MIWEHIDSEEIPWSVGAVQQAAEYLHQTGKLFRESDVHSGQRGEFTAPGTRLAVYPKSANALTSAPPVQPQVEVVERKQRFTVQQIRAMSAAEYAERMRNPFR